MLISSGWPSIRIRSAGPAGTPRFGASPPGSGRLAGAPADLCQPFVVADRPVTFWRELPPHGEGSIEQVAGVLRRLHSLRPPAELALPPLAPFVRLADRLARTDVFGQEDREWLGAHLRSLQQRYDSLPPGLPRCAVHGDAWGGNIVATPGGPVMLDLERFAFGAPEWDLASIAVDHFTFGTTSAAEWETFCAVYGYDVTGWAGFPSLRDARELRKVTFAAQMAETDPALRDNAHHRLACIQGRHGPRPWNWIPVP